MEFFFNPQGVAVIGATANQLKGGYHIFKNLVSGYQGGIYPVNPRYADIDGITCYASVKDVPDPVDMAIVFVSASIAVKAVRECALRGLQGVMIQSAGFAETGDTGRALQAELLAIKAEFGIRIWGPNCMGLVDAVNRHVFSFVLNSIWDDGLIPGNVSLIVQSGLLSAGFLIDTVSHGTMGISKACSLGNKADINECDLLEYLIDDPQTEAIGAYLESITDGNRFLKTCRRSRKPIVILKGGKSQRGAQAAMSHTASLAGDADVIRGALTQVGVTEANDFKQMVDLCRSRARYNHIQSDNKGRIAILTYSGGAGIVSADFVDQMGLTVADLSPQTLDQLATVYPQWMPPANPVDFWPAIEKSGPDKVYQTAFKAVCSDPGVDAVLFHIFIGGFVQSLDIAPLASIAQKYNKPLFIWLLGERQDAHNFQLHAHENGVPVFRELHRAVECLSAVFKKRS